VVWDGPVTAATVRLLYALDDGVSGVDTWSYVEFDGPGTQLLSDLTDGAWYALQAVVTDTEASLPSNLVRAQPRDGTSYYGVDLARGAVEEYTDGHTTGYRMQVTATGVNLPDEVFLYQREPFPLSSVTRDVMIAVCRPGDLEEFPADAPVDGQEPPFFRLAALDFYHPCLDELEETWESLVADVNDLLINMELNRYLGRSATVSLRASVAVTGTEDDGSSSSSGVA